MTIDPSRIVAIAQVCHEANRAYCQTIGDMSQVPWGAAPSWQRESAIQGVRFRLDVPNATAEMQHTAWCDAKRADGWVYGEVKDAEKRTHPCLLPYSELPENQRVKDRLFGAIVDVMR